VMRNRFHAQQGDGCQRRGDGSNVRLQSERCVLYMIVFCKPWWSCRDVMLLGLKQGRAGQGRAGQGRAGQGRAGQGRAEQDRPGQGRAEQDRPGQSTQGPAHIRPRLCQTSPSDAINTHQHSAECCDSTTSQRSVPR